MVHRDRVERNIILGSWLHSVGVELGLLFHCSCYCGNRRTVVELKTSGRHLWDRKTERKTGHLFSVLKPASSAVGSDGSFLIAAHSRKSVFRTFSSISPLPRVLASQGTDHKTWRASYAPLRVVINGLFFSRFAEISRKREPNAAAPTICLLYTSPSPRD